MPETSELPSDEFLVLLTDALRSGPGSPEWSEAVKALRNGDAQVDEYTLLCRARERLAEGKEYRSVRAGPNFTHKVMEGIDKQSGSPPVSMANLIALLAVSVIVAVVVAVVVLLVRSPSDPQQHAIETLQSTIFGSRITAASFGDGVPLGWRSFGDLPLSSGGGVLRPTTMPSAGVNAASATTGPANGGSEAYRVGGWITSEAIHADQVMQVDAVCKPGKGTEDGIVQVFVSDEPITEANMAGGHALVYQLRAGESRAFLPDGKQAPQSEKVNGEGDVSVRITLNKDLAIVEAGGKRLYAGGNLLSGAQGRYVGVRFLGRAGEKWERLAVGSLVVQKP